MSKKPVVEFTWAVSLWPRSKNPYFAVAGATPRLFETAEMARAWIDDNAPWISGQAPRAVRVRLAEHRTRKVAKLERHGGKKNQESY